jgi:hypothetical protein
VPANSGHVKRVSANAAVVVSRARP